MQMFCLTLKVSYLRLFCQDLGDTSTLADPSVVDVLKSYHPRKKGPEGYAGK